MRILFAHGDRMTWSINLSGDELRKKKTLAKHYRTIDRYSCSSKELTETELCQIKSNFGSGAEIYGGMEFVSRFSEVTPSKLLEKWRSKKVLKLRSGVYFQCFQFDELPHAVVIINGFYPHQLNYYYRPEAWVRACCIRTNRSWKDIRQLLGSTDPSVADQASLRGVLHSSRHEFNLPFGSHDFNFLHISAGPIEGLAELLNFGAAEPLNLRISQTISGLALQGAGFRDELIRYLLDDPETDHGRVFTFTEELDTDAAVLFLSTCVRWPESITMGK